MEAKELRIGNYVYKFDIDYRPYKPIVDYDCFEAIEVNIEILRDIHNKSKTDYDCYKPIPLTEEWLLKFGFKKKSSSFVIFPVSIKKQTKNAFFYSPTSLNLKSVHQLQNLYFALTGEELTVRELA